MRDFVGALAELDPDIPLLLQPGNHDLHQARPNATVVHACALVLDVRPRAPHGRSHAVVSAQGASRASIERYRGRYGDDYYSFWAGGVCYISLNSQVVRIFDYGHPWLR